MIRTLYWRPCPYFCPDSPDHFRSWAMLMAARAGVDGPVTIDVPEAAPFPRGTHDLSEVSITVTECRVIVGGIPGARCVPRKPYAPPALTPLAADDPRVQAALREMGGGGS